MICGYTGTPGSGKTYEAVKAIIENLKVGRIVYTNIDGLEKSSCREFIKQYTGISYYALERQLKIFDNDQTSEFWMHIPPQALVVIDEVQNFFNSRDWQNQANRKFGEWASTHRHNGYDCILITQNAERLESSVRSLFEWNYVFRKVNFFGSLVQKKYLVYIHAGDKVTGNPLTTERRSYDNKIFACYKSYVADDIQEQGFITTTNLLKHPVFYAIPICLALVIYFFSKSSVMSGDVFGSKSSMEVVDKADPKKPVEVQQHSENIWIKKQANGVARYTNRS